MNQKKKRKTNKFFFQKIFNKMSIKKIMINWKLVQNNLTEKTNLINCYQDLIIKIFQDSLVQLNLIKMMIEKESVQNKLMIIIVIIA